MESDQNPMWDRLRNDTKHMIASQDLAVGERVCLLKPAERTEKGRKLARPFHRPYHVVEITSIDARVRRVDRPQDEPISVALD